MKEFWGTVLLAILILTANSALGVPIQWRGEDGGNDHWYDVVNYSGTWDAANVHAQQQVWSGMLGHLATVTSAEENAFLWTSFPYIDCWLGGYQLPATTVTDNWAWVTDEAWDYTAWHPIEPNDGANYIENGQEDHISMTYDGTWNDVFNYLGYPRYFVEYEPTTPVPEPSTIALLGLGIACVRIWRRGSIQRNLT